MSQFDSSSRPPSTERAGVDPRSVVISGVTTFAWYAVPDVVRPRWARALAKTGVLATGVLLAMGSTREGAEARAAVEDLRSGIRSAQDQPRAAEPEVAELEVASSGRAVVATAAVVGGMAVAGTLAVLGERWVYRFAERLRGRGVRAPHATVGLVLGAAAAGMSAIDVPVNAERSRSGAE
ncbi:hypothetical protein GCM10009718_12120 [Isoptericola halotolerans]|uniref:Peptidase S9 n=1 Tax=Isoptericola halotolerans TaxID=300560 RepID=A0ABX2A2N9_9MICO|nr:hypothetical protein [Isoptericola halotolerans]NOV95866.1 hypothetical protein [Isoptericola halotolerans]